ncbi:flagellar type III secretion system pore protein FliP [Marmoricola sp. URHB0036]|uniref:flagellar type III secretion system pore protein FliP n=1 Tax=Marmoricola sp. URHB0036 TaxID=1298863 RepID=UPI0004167704|nr:flagellar type III secretion system pore protein FliP [Marmoricola sp. URHB0036]
MSAGSRTLTLIASLFAGFVLSIFVLPGAANAATTTSAPASAAATVSTAVQLPAAPADPAGPKGPKQKNSNEVNVKLSGLTNKPSTSVSVILTMTLLSLLPAIVLTCTSFTKILVVLGLTRNALGLQQSPPNQVLAGLALFLSLFIMTPVLTAMNHDGLKPYMDGTKTSAQAWEDGSKPLKAFMLKNTDDEQLELLTNVAKRDLPKDRADVPFVTLVPAFVLSELKQAFIIGFIVFIPFLVIDFVVSGALMALGMMMMPPVMVSLPFKLLLFVMVDGWGLLIKSLIASYG